MSEYVNHITGHCPSCGRVLSYDPTAKDQIIECEACDQSFSVAQLLGNTSSPAAQSAGAGVIPVENSAAALAYLDSYFDCVDWNEFARNADISFSDIDKMVENVLIKAAADPASWELSFNSVAVPLEKKIEGLNYLKDCFLEQYIAVDELDDNEAMKDFDAYRSNTKRILDAKDGMLQKLDRAIRFAEKHGAEESALADMRERYEKLEETLTSISVVEMYRELPGYMEAEKKKQARIAAELDAKGIQAELVYVNAVESFESGNRSGVLLSEFNTVRGYKNASEFIKKLNVWVDFEVSGRELLRIADKYFLVRAASLPVLGTESDDGQKLRGKKKKLAELERQEETNAISRMKRTELLPIVDGKVVENAVAVTGITKVLAHYGRNLFYVKNNKSICRFDSDNGIHNMPEEVLYEAKFGDFENKSGEIEPISYKDRMFLRTKLRRPEEKTGCLKKLFKKPVEKIEKNNYSLIRVSFADGQTEVVIPEMVDIVCTCGNQIFYTAFENTNGIEKEKFCSYNIDTGAIEELLGSDCEICGVVDNKVVYMMWMPDEYNKDLYVLDIADRQSRLIERNIYSFFRLIDKKIYYTVGNTNLRVLLSIQLDGSGRTEILKNAISVENAQLNNGWLYISKGRLPNRVLLRVKVDGKQSNVVCTQFKKSIGIKDGYLFYLDYQNTLCSVRLDGTEYRSIIEGVAHTFVYDDEVLLTRAEYGAMSLYRVDAHGSELRKVVHGIMGVMCNPYNRDELYLYRRENVTYAIHTPIDAKNYSTENRVVTLEKFDLYNRHVDMCSEVLTLGEPDKTSKEFKSGCLHKKVTKDMIIELVPHKVVIRREGAAEAGDISNENKQHEEKMENTLKNAGKNFAKKIGINK